MVLIFNDGGWAIATASWSLGNEAGADETLITYMWGNSGDATKAWNVTIALPVDEVVDLIRHHAAEGVCDLRGAQGPA